MGEWLVSWWTDGGWFNVHEHLCRQNFFVAVTISLFLLISLLSQGSPSHHVLNHIQNHNHHQTEAE